MLLTDEEIQELLDVDFRTAHSGHVAEYQLVAKAQLKEAVKELKDRVEQMGDFDHDDHPFNTNPDKDTRWHFSMWKPQEEWDRFWQALLKEVE